MDAVNAGDLEAVAEAWERAGRDPELEELLLELDAALFVEARGNASPLREPSGRPRRRWAAWAGVSAALAAVCLIAVLVRPRHDGNDTIASPGRNQPLEQVSARPPDGSTGLAPLLASRRDLNEAEMPAFTWPFENTVSTSSPLDLPD
jgi:ferric-dicitrate binding protein FerR (iron transport regulator)